MTAPHVVVVGAGIGGLSAACQLAAMGARVTVLERHAEVGGKAGRLRAQGFAWDTGPTLLTMPDVIDEVLALAGTSLANEVELVPLAPLCRYRFASGASLDHVVDVEATAAAMRAIDAHDAARWPDFVAHARHLFEHVGEPYLRAPYAGTLEFAGRVARKGPAALIAGASFGTLAALAAKWFRSPELRMMVGRLATYVGARPEKASAALAMIAHAEGRGDAVYPRGGMASVAQALGRAAVRLGCTVHTQATVARVAAGASRGGWRVETTSGLALAADAVILNVDPAYAAAHLLTPDTRVSRGLEDKRPRSLSAAVMLFGLRGQTPGLALHNVFFPANYSAEFDDVMDRGLPPTDGTVYVSSPSRVDPATAPPGHEAIFALVNAPAAPELDWPSHFARLREHVLSKLATLDPGIRERVVCERTLGPRELAATGSLDGAIYGAAPHGMRGPFLRPSQRVTGARGLYLAGSSTHPGGGVPMVALSGRHAADLAAQDLGLAVTSIARKAAT